jgi:signal transduction histidine kinase
VALGGCDKPPGAGTGATEQPEEEKDMQQHPACDVVSSHRVRHPIRFAEGPQDSRGLDESGNLEDLAQRISHELRTCLSIVTFLSGNLDLLYERLDDEKRRKMIRDIRKHAQKINSLVESMSYMAGMPDMANMSNRANEELTVSL